MTALLTIRAAQLHALGVPRAEDFVDKLARHVAGVFPDQAERVRGPDGRTLLAGLVERARAYRLLDEYTITLFADLCFGLGLAFDTTPEYVWITDLLELDGLGGTARMYLI